MDISKCIFIFLIILYCSYHQGTCHAGNTVMHGTNSQSTFTSSDGDTCVTRCYVSRLSDNEEAEKDFKLPLLHENRLNETKLKNICKVIKSIQECATTCPDSSYKSAFFKGFAPSNFMCNKSDFIQHSSCLGTAFVEVKSVCSTTSKCGKQIEAVNNYTSNVMVPDELSFYVENLCSYFRCYLDCMREETVEKCTKDGFALLKKLLQMWVNSFKEWVETVNANFYSEPDVCTRFKNDQE